MSRYYKYKVIEYEYKTIYYDHGKAKIDVVKSLHETNSKLFLYLIILCFKINRIKYEII